MLPLVLMLAAFSAGLNAAQPQADIPVKFVSFEDMRPGQVACFAMGYGTIGIDPDDNVYAAWCGDCELCGTDCASSFGNCALFKYNPGTGERKLLGTLREVAKAAGNLGPNRYWDKTEIFMKGHTHLPHLNGKIYMGTQEFHSMAGDEKMSRYRGGHIFAYDIAQDRLQDLSVLQSSGVFAPHQGIIQLWSYPPKNLIVGWTIPRGDLLLYDVATRKLKTKPGRSAEFGKECGREILLTPQGQIYYNYSPLKTKPANERIYKYDMTSDEDGPTPHTTPHYGGGDGDMWGLWNGLAMPRNGKKIYFSTYGYLYRLDSGTGKIRLLTKMLPRREKRKIGRVWGLSMSLDEKKLYWIPTTGSAAWRLYEYDIARNEVTFLKDLGHIIGKQQTSRPPARLSEVSGDDVRDSKGRVYFLRHTYDGSGGSGLLQIDVSARSGPPPL